MTTDINFIISFDSKNKNEAILALESFCVNTNENTFDSNLITNHCDLYFLINEEDSTIWFKSEYDFSRAVQGKILIGMISLTITDYTDGVTTFDFWPVFSNGCQVCLDSKNLKKHFIKLLKEINGYKVETNNCGAIQTIFENKA